MGERPNDDNGWVSEGLRSTGGSRERAPAHRGGTQAEATDWMVLPGPSRVEPPTTAEEEPGDEAAPPRWEEAPSPRSDEALPSEASDPEDSARTASVEADRERAREAEERAREAEERLRSLEAELVQARRSPVAAGPAQRDDAGRIELDTATVESLRELGLSVTQAARVAAPREARGGLGSIDELADVPGLLERQRAALREGAYVEPAGSSRD